jgi:hypothetical protein
MAVEGTGRRRRQIWLYPLLVLGLATALLFFGLLLVDWLRWYPTAEGLTQLRVTTKPSILGLFFNFDPDTAQNALGNLAQVITAVLGIVITVASIVVQLAATRYTPRITDMFFRDRTNLLVIGFFVVAAIDAVWVSLSVHRDFIPLASITVSLLLVSFSVLLMMPYFAYVFDFLDPEKVVARIQDQALASAIARDFARDSVPQRQNKVLQSVEQLSDVAMNAISSKDKLIAQGAVDALKGLVTSYLPHKRVSDGAWFEMGPRLRQNPDFVSMSPSSVDDLASDKVWLEWKVLRQYQAVFNESVGQMPEMSHLIAIDTRYIGESAIETKDGAVLAMVVKFFNTYMRSALNADQIRTAYNVMNQYRQMGERIVTAGQDKIAVEVAGYFRYYSLLAHAKHLSFITETVSYDLATLCETAHGCKAQCHDGLLKVLLDLDREAETVEQEQILRGVRKAQAKLAAYYLSAGDEQHARVIRDDMKGESKVRLQSIRDELMAIKRKDFWEVIDRGTNFDYMDDPRKEKLAQFFSWFESLTAPTPN